MLFRSCPVDTPSAPLRALRTLHMLHSPCTRVCTPSYSSMPPAPARMLAYVSRAKDARHLACACERVCAWVLNACTWVLNAYARVLRAGALIGVRESLESYAWCRGWGYRGRRRGCRKRTHVLRCTQGSRAWANVRITRENQKSSVKTK